MTKRYIPALISGFVVTIALVLLPSLVSQLGEGFKAIDSRFVKLFPIFESNSIIFGMMPFVIYALPFFIVYLLTPWFRRQAKLLLGRNVFSFGVFLPISL